MEPPGKAPGSVVRLYELLSAEDFPERDPAPAFRQFAEEVDRGLEEITRTREEAEAARRARTEL